MGTIQNIPSIDLADFLSGNQALQEKFISALGKAYEEIGFVAVKNHGLSDQTTEKLYSLWKEFYNLPQHVKDKYEIEGLGGQRGYTGKNKETAKGFSVADLKEFYHVGQPSPDTKSPSNDFPDNIFVEEVPELVPHSIEVYQTLEKSGIYLLQAIALYLGLSKDYFSEFVAGGNSILRPIHYFPIDDSSNQKGAVRAAAHEDINLITLLMGASAEGLEILNKQDEWIAVTALPDQIIVNVGDMLSRLTNNKLVSTTHRVVNPPESALGTSRYSIPFFLHPVPYMPLDCLESCIDDQNKKQFENITAGDYLRERLIELGLIKA